MRIVKKKREVEWGCLENREKEKREAGWRGDSYLNFSNIKFEEPNVDL